MLVAVAAVAIAGRYVWWSPTAMAAIWLGAVLIYAVLREYGYVEKEPPRQRKWLRRH